MRINELFDVTGAYPLKWARASGTAVSAKGVTEGGDEIEIFFIDSKTVDGLTTITFDRGGSMDITKGRDAVRIFTTVIGAIEKYIKENRPKYVYFNAYEPSRKKFYRHLTARYTDKWGYRKAELEDMPLANQRALKSSFDNQEMLGMFFLVRKDADNASI